MANSYGRDLLDMFFSFLLVYNIVYFTTNGILEMMKLQATFYKTKEGMWRLSYLHLTI